MMTSTQAAKVMQGQHHGIEKMILSAEIDSRRVEAGSLFFAIKGDQQDGHEYIAAATENGALAAVVEFVSDDADITQIQVKDTTLSLGLLAKDWRARFNVPVVGITGSNGKTTVSAMLREIFAIAMPGIAPQGSFNNHWGVPLTLLKLRAADQSAVIEMGMNHPGELRYLTDIVKPTVAVINNAAAAHLEGLTDVQGVAKAKAEIIQGVPEDGVVVLNYDDPFYAYWRDLAGSRQVLSFGLSAEADVSASYMQTDAGLSFNLNYQQQSICIKLNVLGEHNILNALAAATAALAVGVEMADIALGLSNVEAVTGRLVTKTSPQGACVIDDTYNANPASIEAGLRVLGGRKGQRIAVLGAMAELGDESFAQHQKIGGLASELGIDGLFAVGDAAEAYQSGFGSKTICADDIDEAVALITPRLNKNVTVLVKGSRSAGMERLVEAIIAPQGTEEQTKQSEVSAC